MIDEIMKIMLADYKDDIKPQYYEWIVRCMIENDNKESAKLAYKHLKEEYGCTIWVQKIEFVDPKEEFKEA